MAEDTRIPLLEHEPSETPVFTAVNLLEAARIRKGLPKVAVPAGCLLDFDGELVQHLAATGRAVEDSAWPCFHTRLFRWQAGNAEYGVIGGTVGAPYAVLVAEELFALGCRALVSISSAGLVAERFAPPFFLLIDRALRDEGTSCHYLPPGRYADADPSLIAAVRDEWRACPSRYIRARRGPRMLPSGRRKASSRRGAAKGSFPWRWKRPRYWPSERPSTSLSYALPT